MSLIENKNKGPLFPRRLHCEWFLISKFGWLIGDELHDFLQEKQIHHKLCRIYLLIKEVSTFWSPLCRCPRRDGEGDGAQVSFGNWSSKSLVKGCCLMRGQEWGVGRGGNWRWDGLGLALLGSIFPADCVGRRGAQLAHIVGDLGLYGGLRTGIKPLSTTAHQSAGQQAHRQSHIDYMPIYLRSQPSSLLLCSDGESLGRCLSAGTKTRQRGCLSTRAFWERYTAAPRRLLSIQEPTLAKRQRTLTESWPSQTQLSIWGADSVKERWRPNTREALMCWMNESWDPAMHYLHRHIKKS